MLLNELKEGSHEAFGRIFNHYWESLYGIAFNRLRSHADAEDVVQQVFVNLWNRKEQLVVARSLDAYLACSVRYQVYNLLRYRKVREVHATAQDELFATIDNSTLEQLSFNELYERFEALVSALPPKCQLVFTMSRIQGYTNSEIAEQLGLSSSTVENHLNKALKTLRTSLGEALFIAISIAILNS